MKKSKAFVAAGVFVLTVTAIFATKANKKFTTLTTGYADNLGVYIVSNQDAAFPMTSAQVTGSPVKLNVDGSFVSALVTGTNGTAGVKLYYK